MPTFYPLRESTRTVELLDERVRQRVAESLSALSHETGLPVEESTKPELVRPEGVAPGSHVSEASGRAVVAEPATQPSESQHLAWYEPLRRLIRRFLPSFNPRSHTELESGVSALSSGLDAMNDEHARLAARRDELENELRAAEELLEEASRQSHLNRSGRRSQKSFLWFSKRGRISVRRIAASSGR